MYRTRHDLLTSRFELHARILLQAAEDGNVCGLAQVVMVAAASRDDVRIVFEIQAQITGQFGQAIAAFPIVARIGINEVS